MLLSITVMTNFDTFMANEAIAMIKDMVASDGEDFQMNSAIVLLARMEEAEAVTDEDSDHDDPGDVNQLPRRVLINTAYKHCSDNFGNAFN